MSGRWLGDVPGPIVLVLCVVVAASIVWSATRDPQRLRHELRASRRHVITSRILAALPVPVTRAIALALAALIVGYGVSRVV